MNRDPYKAKLFARLTDVEKWSRPEPSDDFLRLAQQVDEDVRDNRISGKIAAIFVKHQIVHEMTKDLIETSTLYLQGEIWPSVIEPKYDGGKDQMTGWYLSYYADHTINCKAKTDFVAKAKRINELRNAVAHKMTGKNDVVINSTYKEFTALYAEVFEHYNDCYNELYVQLRDLTQRVEFELL